MADSILVLVPDGKVHRKWHGAHGYSGLDACNLDDTNAEQEISEDEFAAMSPSVACRNCMGEDDATVQHTVLTVDNDSETLP